MCVKVEQVWLDGGSLAKLAAPIRLNNLNKLTANDLKKNELLSTERFIKSVSLKYLDHQFINFLRCRIIERGVVNQKKRPRPTAHLFNLFFFKNKYAELCSLPTRQEKFKAKISFIAGLSRSLASTWREQTNGAATLSWWLGWNPFHLSLYVITMITMSRKCLSIVSRHFRGVSLLVVKGKKASPAVDLKKFSHFLY